MIWKYYVRDYLEYGRLSLDDLCGTPNCMSYRLYAGPDNRNEVESHWDLNIVII